VAKASWYSPVASCPVFTENPTGLSSQFATSLKGVIISGGETISSVEVEGALLQYPAVQEVTIVGFPHERCARRSLESSSPKATRRLLSATAGPDD
jgi:acyl-CoA synthetase (AMP-forming)/AMP-acid ligase II